MPPPTRRTVCLVIGHGTVRAVAIEAVIGKKVFRVSREKPREPSSATGLLRAPVWSEGGPAGAKRCEKAHEISARSTFEVISQFQEMFDFAPLHVAWA
tara:strand:- start:5788 stop:6081 length:294 start_codon:yes stop_codon:yes gene_type:complete